MPLRKLLFVLLALCAFPAVAPAGLIQFGLSATNVTSPSASPDAPLLPIRSSGNTYTFDTATGIPVTIPVVKFDPSMIPTPQGANLHPDGTTHSSFNENFTVDLTVTNYATGHTANFQLSGVAHVFSDYSTETGWTGTSYFWFQDYTGISLDGQHFQFWGTNTYSSGPATVDVWMGDGRPPIPQWTPEPGTFALAALGLIPLGLRRFRRQ